MMVVQIRLEEIRIRCVEQCRLKGISRTAWDMMVCIGMYSIINVWKHFVYDMIPLYSIEINILKLETNAC